MKKFLISTALLTMLVFSFSCISFADTLGNNTKKVTNTVGNVLSETANGAKNMVGHAENAVENGANNVKNATTNTAEKAGNTTRNVANSVTGAMTNMGNDNYDAQRTNADTTAFGMSTTAWTWIILGIVGAAIVGLVWYYGSQYEHTNYND